MMNRTHLFLLALGSLFLATSAQAQLELKAGNFNSIYVAQDATGEDAPASGPSSLNNQTLTGEQFAAVGQVAGASGPIDSRSTTTLGYGAVAGTISSDFANQYPSTSDNGFVLKRSTIGSSFTSGIPRYFMGDEITPPVVQLDGVTPADATYWRGKPVLPGESILGVALPVTVLSASGNSVFVDVVPTPLVVGSTLLGQTVDSISGTTLTLSGSVATVSTTTQASYIPPTPQVLFPLGLVVVTEADTTSTTVTVTTVPAELKVGAFMLGQPITKIDGSGPATVTLAGKPNANITFATDVDITPTTSFYYSPHAEKVFASQPGRVSITWVTLLPVDGAGNYGLKSEIFAVSSNTQQPVRTIFWTEGSFDGPKVQVTDGRITTVNPVYNPAVPLAVGQEVSIPGFNPTAANLSTLSFEKFNGIGQIKAYNVEGRILVEYLGNVRLAGNIYEFIGLDVVDIKRVPTVGTGPVYLGSEIRPLTEAPAGEARYEASPVLANIQDAASFYGTSTQADGSLVYYAERETSVANDPDNGAPASVDAYNKVVFYWLQEGIFGIKWPQFQNRYWQRWSPELDDYAHYTVAAGGSTPDTGVAFSGGLLPEIIFQDDPAQAEAQIDLATQRLFVDFSNGAQSNRSLLKFSTSEDVWYVNIYTQTEDRSTTRQSTSSTPTTSPTVVTVPSTANLTVGMEVSGAGITGTATIINIINETQYELSKHVLDATVPLYYLVGVQSDTEIWTPADLLITIPSTVGFENITYADFPIFDDITAVLSPTELSYVGGTYQLDGTYEVQYYLDDFNGDYPMVTSEITFIPTGPTKFFIWSFALPQPLEVGMFISGSGFDGFVEITVLDGSISGTLDLPPTPTLRGSYTFSRKLTSTSRTDFPATVVTVSSTTGLEVGMVVSGPGIMGLKTIQEIISSTEYVLSEYTPDGSGEFTYTVESDDLTPINTTATVGTRLTPPAGHEDAGYISGGTGYFPEGYLNPFVVGVEAAKQGAIIPVNALPDDNVLTVHWYKKFNLNKPNSGFQDIYVPGKIGRYTVSFPTNADQIVIAQGIGTGDLPPAQAAGTIYFQNDPAQIGYNPNEEHAPSILGGRAYALRDDLNSKFIKLIAAGWDTFLQVDDTSTLRVGMTVIMPGDAGEATLVEIINGSQMELSRPVAGDGEYVFTTGEYTSEPFVLLAYTDPTDDRPAIHAYEVVRENAEYDFDYTATAGTLLIKPYPLPLLPQPLVGTGVNRTTKDIEILGADDPDNATVSTDIAYDRFTFKDRNGFTWVHRGPHDDGSPTLTMKLYYLSQPGFFLPGLGEPTDGTLLPFLRNAPRSGESLNLSQIDNGQVDEPLAIIYRPVWPDDAPELRVAETLTLPKFGLPQVRGQSSAQILYQQSIANALTATELTKNSVTLHDPTREKTVVLGAAGISLEEIPDSIRTTDYQGKVYFQNLPPHLQQRFYFDPLREAKGTLILIGAFYDVLAGEDYLDLNVLTANEVTQLKALDNGVDENAPASDWDAAIDALSSTVETFIPDPAQFGSYIADPNLNATAGESELAIISSPNTAVDSYAITATGQGTGFVTMVFGNGGNPDQQPQGDPVQVQVFKIADELYVGDLKVVLSSNPLDEQVTLRHSGDFAGKPEDYNFEWRWATGEASAPATYSFIMTKRIGKPAESTNESTNEWLVVSDPGALKPTADQYTAAAPALPFARSENVNPVQYDVDVTTVIEASSYTAAEAAAGYPSLVLKSDSGVDFSVGVDSPYGVPGSIVFSAKTGSFDGFVLYVNNRIALAHNAPTPQFTLTNASSGLTDFGKGDGSNYKQFSIPPSFFIEGVNTIEVAIYTTADANAASSLDFVLEAAKETDLVVTGATWNDADPSNAFPVDTNIAIIGGGGGRPFSGSTFVLNDRWFTMRYQPTASADNVLGTQYSRWMPPQFVPGWVKRVLSAITPFQQRVTDLYNNSVDTDVSVITQAGKRWEGDIALTMDNINDVGLIEIYETVLNRAKNFSIDANTNDSDSNNALLLAAGYLSDLYTLLGNEAFADAANPTISIDDQSTLTEVNTSRFSFEAQVASSLEEELALLRGRDDRVSPGVITGPAYNRLYWNYTGGINSGEVLYAVNYNIKEKVGSDQANGVIDEADAQRLFPQGHGDAYGHYLTAIKGYYTLLSNDNFDWKARAEAMTVAGQAVTVDFQDERKFAAAAGNIARTAEQVISLTHRQSYQDDPASGWSSYRDDTGTNTSTGVTRHQGLDEWVSRGTQGALYHWAVANALVPDVDTYHSGVQKIDRTTVLEIPQLATYAGSFQTTIDNANARLNPLGLSPDAIAFDISPSEMKAGNTHYEQVYARSLRALNNAAGAFNQAAVMTRSLRDQQNQIDDYATTIAQQESAYIDALIDIYGRPYSGDIGAGKTFAQGYVGPDLFNWSIVDRPNGLADTSESFTITIEGPLEFAGDSLANLSANRELDATTSHTVTVAPSSFVQYNDTWRAGGLGTRAETGTLQNALLDAQQTYLALADQSGAYSDTATSLARSVKVFNALVKSHFERQIKLYAANLRISSLEKVVLSLDSAADVLEFAASFNDDVGDSLAEFFPRSIGFSTDATSGARGAAKLSGGVAAQIANGLAVASRLGAGVTRISILDTEQSLEQTIQALEFGFEEVQMAYEIDVLYREHIGHSEELMQLTLAHQRALQQVQNVAAKGNRILADREIFRQRAAAIIQGYRTKDLTFRLFRNEALEQYRTLFDLASRYTYLAAKSYDYETGLLGTTAGQNVFNQIVASRALGDLTGGTPQSTTSTLGDSGLAGTMAQLNADFSVAEGRLGLNNPDQYGTIFSLRHELFRILNDPAITSDDEAWQQALENNMVKVDDLMADADIAAMCLNLRRSDGAPVPGFVISFSTTIQQGKNFFGLDLAAGDHAFTSSSFATKIYSAGVALPGYVGMDTYASGNQSGAPTSTDANALSATPYVYLIPTGRDYMRAPALGDTDVVRSWNVADQALPLPYNLGATDFNSNQFFSANGTLSEQPWILRKHQAFRAVQDPTLFYSRIPQEFTNSRLIGRSVWNGQWKIVIPAYTLLNDEQQGLDNFIATVKDIQLFLRTYSNSGN
jgi:hypothetical protein